MDESFCHPLLLMSIAHSVLTAALIDKGLPMKLTRASQPSAPPAMPSLPTKIDFFSAIPGRNQDITLDAGEGRRFEKDWSFMAFPNASPGEKTT